MTAEHEPDRRSKALRALRAARVDAKTLVADRWQVSKGQRYGWASAAQVEQVFGEATFAHDIEVHFRGAHKGALAQHLITTWVWSHDDGVGVWESEPIHVEVFEDPGVPGASSAAVTIAGKIVRRQLLGLVKVDEETGLLDARERTRARMPELVRELLRATARRGQMSEERLIAQSFPDVAQAAARIGKAVSINDLAPAQLWALGGWLTMAADSEKWEPGKYEASDVEELEF